MSLHITRWAPMVAVLSSLGCSATIPDPEAAAPLVPRAAFDTSTLSSKQLADQLVPRHRHASHLLAPMTDTSFLEQYQGTPLGRLAERQELFELDQKFQAEVAKLVHTGVIGPTTLVIDDTGHSIPNLARVMAEPSLGVVSTVHFHWNPYQQLRRRQGRSLEQETELMDSSLGALADQVQTFGDVIEEHQEQAAQSMATVLYVALDGERYLDLRTQQWPTAEDFLVFGMTRVVVLIERAKLWDYGTADVAPDLLPWLRSLQDGGMPMQVIGIDARVGAMTRYGRPSGGGVARFGAER